MSKKTLLLMEAIILFLNQSDNPYSIPYSEPNKPYKPSQTKRNLQTFLIKGQEIQAYSKKDAIKRYTAQNKKK